MTTVAYRDGVLAADSRAYSGDKVPIGTKAKIHRLEDGTIYGISTNNVGGDAVLRRWVEGGCLPADSGDLKPDSFELLVVRPSGEVFYANGNLDLTGPLSAQFWSIGSGNEYALGAMARGADAEDAVRVGCELDPWSDGPITILRLEPTS